MSFFHCVFVSITLIMYTLQKKLIKSFQWRTLSASDRAFVIGARFVDVLDVISEGLRELELDGWGPRASLMKNL